MSDDEGKALVPRPSGELQRVDSAPGRLLSTVVGDALGFARATALHGARFRLGDFEFREPDYSQIQIWAECLGISADEVLRRLEASTYDTYEQLTGPELRFLVVDAAIRTLVIDPAEFVWPDGRLDLSAIPGLTKLCCGGNQLTELDLSAVPELTNIYCGENQLTELELSAVPGLTKLRCEGNQLTELDLSAVPGLTELICRGNQLTELDLSAVPWLRNLSCGGNQLTELDLSRLPELTWLDCVGSKITQLDVRANLKLNELSYDPRVLVTKRPDQVIEFDGW